MGDLSIQDTFEPYYVGRDTFAAKTDKDERARLARKLVERREAATEKAEKPETTEH